MVVGTRVSPLRRGVVVGGRYRVEDIAGRGGMSVVVRATDLEAHRPVALKVLHPERQHRDRDVARLLREARLIAQLESPHAARLYEASTFSDGGIEVPFLALEYVDGVDLATWLRAKGPLDAATAATIVVQACDALGEAHARGLVHRDIKPANLMLTASQGHELVVKVLDFGIAREMTSADERLTATGDILGSPTYMAPEQMRPDVPVDARADVWSLGVVLYELVAGTLPFSSRSLPELCLEIMLDEPAPLPAGLPSELSAIVARCLHKDPNARYASACEVGDALRAVAAPSVALAPTELELAAVDAAAHDITRGAATHDTPVRRRAPRAVIAVGVAAFTVAVALILHARSSSPATTVAAPPAPTLTAPVATQQPPALEDAIASAPHPAAPADRRKPAAVPPHTRRRPATARPATDAASTHASTSRPAPVALPVRDAEPSPESSVAPPGVPARDPLASPF